jgi:hypothetical protein
MKATGFPTRNYYYMGLYNTLIVDLTCPNCEKKSEARIQFQFGQLGLLQYKIGDTIAWGSRNDVGSPNLVNVKLYGIIESTVCPLCNANNIPEEYDIFVTNNVILNVLPIESLTDYLHGDAEGEYVSLDK